MATQEKHESPTSLIHAVEILSNITELELDNPMPVSELEQLEIQKTALSFRTIHWMHKDEASHAVKLIQDTFKTILSFLNIFYNKEKAINDPQTIESIKTIMVLVGEAAKKIDKYIKQFSEEKNVSVTELKEYKALQEFYLSKISPKVDSGLLGKWILALTQKNVTKSLKKIENKTVKSKALPHLVIDLEGVKKDKEYELFYLRKEDGAKFFNIKLIRNIKLLCDFGEFFEEKKQRDPLFDVNEWNQTFISSFTGKIVEKIHIQADRFYGEAKKHKDNELVIQVNKMLIALMLSSRPQPQKNHWGKTSSNYFTDFISFLRQILNCSEYQKIAAYSPKKNKLFNSIFDLVSKVCRLIYASGFTLESLKPIVFSLCKEALVSKISDEEKEKDTGEMEKLKKEYIFLKSLLKHHRGGPLNKVLETLQNSKLSYDPLLLNNPPALLYTVTINGKKIWHMRLPSPTSQELIQRVQIASEFKSFLHTCKQFSLEKILIINTQDRTSWQEHPRCVAIESLQDHDDFASNLTVVTLNKDSDFYHQRADYAHESNAQAFINNLKDQVSSDNSGFYFPEKIKNSLMSFIEPCLESIHELFFNKKNVLPRQARLDFIEIFYLFLQLKLVELSEADIFTFTCKDCLDNSGLASAQLLLFLYLIKGEDFTQNALENIYTLIFGLPLLLRERLPFAERFYRMEYALKIIEFSKASSNFKNDFNKLFDKLYNSSILDISFSS